MSVRPLVIVTRPLAQALPWVEALRAGGTAAQALPLIDIASLDDIGPVAAAWQQLPRLALVMFVSANAVEHFFGVRPPGLGWPADTLAGSTGPGTTAALRAAGVPADCIAAPAPGMAYETESLWAVLCKRDWLGRRALIVRGEDGRDWLADTLRTAGAEPSFLAAYRRLAPRLDGAGRQLLADAGSRPLEHVWHFTSSEAVRHLMAIAPDANWASAWALASHPRIVQAAQQAGFGEADLVGPTVQSVAAAVEAGRGRYNPSGRE